MGSFARNISAQSFFIPQNQLAGFTEHLISYGNISEAMDFALNNLERSEITKSQRDSLRFFIGICFEKQNQDSLSTHNFLQVSDSSALFIRSRFLATRSFIKKKKFAEANDILKGLPLTDNEETNQVKDFLQIGTGLICGKTNAIPPKLNLKPSFSRELQHLEDLKNAKRKMKKKSPWIAGILSAIVPGLGKVYAGSNTQGLSSFIRVAIFGGLSYENYVRHGFNNPQFWLFSGLFSVYYVGGIYGSVYVPKLNYEEKIDAINEDAKVGLLNTN